LFCSAEEDLKAGSGPSTGVDVNPIDPLSERKGAEAVEDRVGPRPKDLLRYFGVLSTNKISKMVY
jgi:hypothetical protein